MCPEGMIVVNDATECANEVARETGFVYKNEICTTADVTYEGCFVNSSSELYFSTCQGASGVETHAPICKAVPSNLFFEFCCNWFQIKKTNGIDFLLYCSPKNLFYLTWDSVLFFFCIVSFFSAETCECLGVKNGDGFGDSCSNVEDSADSIPYCYVSREACTKAGVAVEETTSEVFDDAAIGYSVEVCLGIYTFHKGPK